MALAKRLTPAHRQNLSLPHPWPASAQALLGNGASWLRGSGWKGDLLALPVGPRVESRWDGKRWITWLAGREMQGRPLDVLERATRSVYPWIGALSYELACSEAGLPYQNPAPGDLGLHWQGLEQAIYVEGGKAEIWSWGDPPCDGLQESLAQIPVSTRPLLAQLTPRWSEPLHREAVEAIRAKILDGGFYVANLCVPFDSSWSGDAAALALSCFRRADPPFGAFLPLPGVALLCLSMERVLGKSGSTLTSEPIKGSVPCLGDAAADERAGKALCLDPKERAEHTMIVDLVRNDLGRVAEPGSVQVSELMALHAYPTVQHLVSRVEAQVRPDAGVADILRSMLPAGSVTGAPKFAVCDHIARAEAAPRGFYCGALGWIHDGDFELALPIRTAQLFENHLVYWSGGGITLRSDPTKEWQELLLKTQAFTPPRHP